ncbi:hypothetical protein [Roseococcus thiosulfatophilus]|uniref:hypothetical protein n=1 Tax=Roseococcus thiosulfatophilus TaxID=35813 RepID=UPI001A8C90E1|nr:hypothetical protein [Roseococcus thiosulfatophilus]
MSEQAKPLLKPEQLVGGLGGPVALGNRFGISAQAVCGWYEKGIPARYHLTLWRMATARGLHWHPPGAEGLVLVQASRGCSRWRMWGRSQQWRPSRAQPCACACRSPRGATC